MQRHKHIKADNPETSDFTEEVEPKAKIIELNSDGDNGNTQMEVKKPKIDANFLLPVNEMQDEGGGAKPARELKRLPTNMVYMRD